MKFLKNFLAIFLVIMAIALLGIVSVVIGWFSWMLGNVIVGILGSIIAFSIFGAGLVTLVDFIWDRVM